MNVHKCMAVIPRRTAVVCAAAVAWATTGAALAVVVDDFSGDLSAYTKTVVGTAADETTAMGMTSYIINANDELEFHSYAALNAVHQTVFLRDDYSLGVGQRLQVDYKYFNDVTAGTKPFAGVGLAVAASEAQTFNLRQSIIMVDLNAAYGDQVNTTGRVYAMSFQGTEYQGQQRADVKLADVTGMFINRLSETVFSYGYSTLVGDTIVGSYTNNSIGTVNAAVGFWSDCRTTVEPLARMDNLSIHTLEPVPGVAPVSVLDSSTTLGSNYPQNSYDAAFMWGGKPFSTPMWGGADDTVTVTPDPPVTGHIVYDLGTATTLSDLTIWARSHYGYYLPQNIKIFRFVDDNPYLVSGLIDDIENDPQIVEVWSGTLRDFNDGVGQTIQFTPFTGQYVGIRIDSSYEKTQANFQIGEVRFNAGDQNPAPLPGLLPTAVYNCSDYRTDDSDFKPERMLEGLVSARNVWVAADDDATAAGVNGHVVFDLGTATEVGGVRLWSRKDTARFMLPGDVKVFGFADDNPANILGAIDDIENDPNIIQIWSGSLAAVASGNFTDILFSAGFTGRYVGLRIDSGQADSEIDGNFQISEIRFLTDVVPPVPGDASGDGKVDATDAQLLASNWGMASGAGWGNGDFNNDGAVNAADASILAANWGYGVPGEAAGVPEPSCLVLLSACVIGFAALRRR